MGEKKKFIDGDVTSIQDAQTLMAGFPAMIDNAEAGYLAAVGKLAAATRQGDVEKVAVIKAEIGEFVEQMESLGQEVAEVQAYLASLPVDPGEESPQG